MSYGYSRGAQQYQQIGAHGASYADPHQLVKMLMDGVLDRIAQAKGALRKDDKVAKGNLIGKAINIVAGLQAALDGANGGEVAANLSSLYDYMQRRLLEANMKNDEAPLDEVAKLMRELRAGWEAMPADARGRPAQLSGGNVA